MNLQFIVYSFTRIMDKYLIRKPRAQKKKKNFWEKFLGTPQEKFLESPLSKLYIKAPATACHSPNYIRNRSFIHVDTSPISTCNRSLSGLDYGACVPNNYINTIYTTNFTIFFYNLLSRQIVIGAISLSWEPPLTSLLLQINHNQSS